MAFYSVLHQVVVMFLLMLAGYLLYRAGFVTEEGCRAMSRVLLMIVAPCVILLSFQITATGALLRGLGISALAALGAHLFAILLSHLVFSRRTADDAHRGVLRFAAVYSNCGFMGIPLLMAVAGSRGVFYASAYIAVFNLFNWSHGVALFTGRTDRAALKKLALNPNLIAVAAGLLCFLLRFRLPGIAADSLKYLADMNTPLAMLVLGGRMAKVDLRTMLADRWIWPGVVLRNLAVPLACLLGLHLAGTSGVLLLSCLLPAACPVAGNTVLFADLYGGGTEFPSKIMAVSTALSVVTIPLLVYIVTALHF